MYIGEVPGFWTVDVISIDGVVVEGVAEMAKATITTTYVDENGEETTKEEIIEGTLEEVEAKVNAMKGEGTHGKMHFKIDASKGEKSKMVKIEVQKKS